MGYASLVKYGILGLAAFMVLSRGKEIGTYIGTGAGQIVGSAFTGFSGSVAGGLSSAIDQIAAAGQAAGQDAAEQRQQELVARAKAGEDIPSDTGMVLVDIQPGPGTNLVQMTEAQARIFAESQKAAVVQTGVTELKPTGVSESKTTGQTVTTVAKQFYAGTAGIADVISTIAAERQTAPVVQEAVSAVSTQTGQQNISPPGISTGQQVISKSLQMKYYGRVIYPGAPE